VNDPYQWIRNLEKFIVEIDSYNKNNESKPIKLFGVCYGHQLIAKAFGGVVCPIRSPKKFIFGSDKVNLDEGFYSLNWYKDVYGSDRKDFRIMKVHGEEVSEYPNNAVNVGHSENCPHEVALYGDHIASFQGHPEFTIDKMCDVLGPRLNCKGAITSEMLEDGRKTSKLVDKDILKLVVNFLRGV